MDSSPYFTVFFIIKRIFDKNPLFSVYTIYKLVESTIDTQKMIRAARIRTYRLRLSKFVSTMRFF